MIAPFTPAWAEVAVQVPRHCRNRPGDPLASHTDLARASGRYSLGYSHAQTGGVRYLLAQFPIDRLLTENIDDLMFDAGWQYTAEQRKKIRRAHRSLLAWHRAYQAGEAVACPA